jgi:hypothetical protein
MKNNYSIIFLLMLSLFTSACKKDLNQVTSTVIDQMIVNKTWHLDYSIIGTKTQSFVGQTSYSITYFKDGTTKDSDGLSGTYTISNNNNGKYQIQVKGTSVNGNALNYTHIIESVSDITMVQSFILTGQSTKTALYFSSK